MTSVSSTRQLDNGEDRVEGKQDSWLDEITCTQYREPHEVNNGEDGLQWQGIRELWAPGARLGLKRVESLAASGLYCMVYYF